MKRQVKTSVGRSVGYSMAESVGEIAAGPAGTGLINIYTGALAAHSVARQLSSTYTGALIRVRRSSDNAEQDIGQVLSNTSTYVLDVAAMETFVGAGDGFVVTMYDQSGNTRDATQATAAIQPQIIVSGVTQTLGANNRPAARYATASAQQLATAAYSHGTKQVAAFIALRKGSDAVAAIPFGFGASGGGQNGCWRLWAPVTDLGPNVGFQTQGNSNPAAVTLASVTASLNLVLGAIASHETPQGVYQIRANRSLTASSSVSAATGASGTLTATFSTRALQFGSATFAGIGRPFEGLIGEGLVYGTMAAHSASAGIDLNMMTFWGIGA